MSHPLIEVLATAFVTFLMSGAGFWTYLQKRNEAKDATTMLLMGLASDKLTFLGLRFVERGWVYKDEFEDLDKYLYKPYIQLGGNGSAERIMHAVERLPIRSNHILDTTIRATDRTAIPPEEIDDPTQEGSSDEHREQHTRFDDPPGF